MPSDILVVGKRDSILGFKTVGLETLFWENREASVEELKQFIEEGMKIIFITENIFEEIQFLINAYSGKIYPVFVPIPDITGSSGVSAQNIRNLVIKALGTDILSPSSGEDKK